MPAIENDWKEALSAEFKEDYYKRLFETVKAEYSKGRVFPPKDDIFNALHFTPLSNVKAVILGQDPYHGPNQAHGLCFSVNKGVAIPPSLENIYKELHDDIGIDIPSHGYLESWARQGVLLLNTVLTVRAHEANSHKGIGWEKFTDAIIKCVDAKPEPVVFFLWGRPAQQKLNLLLNKRHLILKAPHPSPLSAYRGFFGCGHFSKCNQFLSENGVEPIDWEIK